MVMSDPQCPHGDAPQQEPDRSGEAPLEQRATRANLDQEREENGEDNLLRSRVVNSQDC
jgi:hypothetical protein